MPGRADEIGVLEAAYDLDPDRGAWLSRLLSAARGVLGGDLGAYAWLADAGGGAGAPRLTELIVQGGPPRLEGAIHAIHSAAHPDVARRGYARRATTLLERVGPAHADFVQGFLGPLAAGDAIGLSATDPSGTSLVVGALLREAGCAPEAYRRSGERLMGHLLSALGLRVKLGDALADPMPRASAVLTPSGRLEHADGSARSREATSALRDAAAAIERARGPLRRRDAGAALDLWRSLVQGRWSIVDRFERDGRRYLIALENPPEVVPHRRLSPRERQVLSEAAQGRPIKLIAYDLGLSVGAVSAYLCAARAKAGFRSRRELIEWFAAAAPPGDAPRRLDR